MIIKRDVLFILCFLFIVTACHQKKNNTEEDIVSIELPAPGPLNEDSVSLLRIKTSLEAHFDLLAKNGLNGCVLVARKGLPIFEKCYGVENNENKKTLNPHTSFQLASASKPFTAMAIVHLWQEGKLSPEDSLRMYFPELPYYGISLSDLLSHRSGLPNYLHHIDQWGIDSLGMIDNNMLLNLLVKHHPPILALPDRTFSYNNTNYALLALIIEKVSGMSYSEYLDKHFFKPLGMKNTFVFSKNHPLPSTNVTTGYMRRDVPDEMVAADGIVGDKNIYSSIEDILLWDRVLYTELIFKKSFLEAAFKPRSFEKSGSRNYGFGWRLTEKPDKSWFIYHNGWWHGYNIAFYRNPSDQTTVVVLSNKYNRNVYKLQPVWEILYGDGKASATDEE